MMATDWIICEAQQMGLSTMRKPNLVATPSHWTTALGVTLFDTADPRI